MSGFVAYYNVSLLDLLPYFIAYFKSPCGPIGSVLRLYSGPRAPGREPPISKASQNAFGDLNSSFSLQLCFFRSFDVFNKR